MIKDKHMPLFGKQNNPNYKVKESERILVRQEVERRAKCQEEINEILKKYGLAIHATFHLVEGKEQTNGRR